MCRHRQNPSVRRTLILVVLLGACGSAAESSSTTTTSSTSTSTTTTTTTIVLPDAPLADQLYTHTLVQFETLMRGMLGFECDEWTVIENGADKGSCLAESGPVFEYETFPGSVRLRADRTLYEAEWRSMYSDGSQCPGHDGDHVAVGHSWIVFSADRTVIDRITSDTGAVYLSPPDC